jgi:hypothetical protein
MGGSNTDTRNFVAMSQLANQWMYDNAEDPVVDALKGAVPVDIFVEVVPVYGNPGSASPTQVDYITFGSVNEQCVIENNATGAGSYC